MQRVNQPTRAQLRALRPATGAAHLAITREIQRGESQLFTTFNRAMSVVVRPEGETLVIVAVAGRDLFNNRIDIINLARANGFRRLRFHTRHPERLRKGLHGLNYQLIEMRPRLFSNEYVYGLEL
ncbi:hypothetical protein [Thalassotalea euphylliae]|uniref:Uncharacterized protein n=1 Tax=Thalassotalea euphylliae TaxID=1655234 RepID=A0A3E0U2C5_9GAMM|nr:hypothetical protein [Thalassotalea euphylliae]REL31078.1 hypothetical protein DXX94_10325 [Thalassotalea euphylliae]